MMKFLRRLLGIKPKQMPLPGFRAHVPPRPMPPPAPFIPHRGGNINPPPEYPRPPAPPGPYAGNRKGAREAEQQQRRESFGEVMREIKALRADIQRMERRMK